MTSGAILPGRNAWRTHTLLCSQHSGSSPRGLASLLLDRLLLLCWCWLRPLFIFRFVQALPLASVQRFPVAQSTEHLPALSLSLSFFSSSLPPRDVSASVASRSPSTFPLSCHCVSALLRSRLQVAARTHAHIADGEGGAGVCCSYVCVCASRLDATGSFNPASVCVCVLLLCCYVLI